MRRVFKSNGERYLPLSHCASKSFLVVGCLGAPAVIRKEAALLSAAGTIAQPRNADRADSGQVRSCLEQNVRVRTGLTAITHRFDQCQVR
jgi:hypothetical protein